VAFSNLNNMNFKISEFVIGDSLLPKKVADKILLYHLLPLQKVRDEIGIPVYPSQNSCYRPVSWEKARGRSGNSQHTFKGMGACDVTCSNFQMHKDKLLDLIIKYTSYTRMAVYKGFIHCDYKPTSDGKRQLFESGGDSRWKFIKNI